MTTDVQRKCENCFVIKTPIWRHGWTTELGKKALLCNACIYQIYPLIFSGGLHFRKGHYCSFCNKIYPPNFEIECEKELLPCSVCSKFEHKKCLESNGIF
jgi:hypothetical protein